MKPHLVLSFLLVAAISSSPLRAENDVWNDSLLAKIRMAATMVPGTLPRSIHVLRFASYEIPLSAVMDGGGNEPYRGTFSVYQIPFEDGWIMVDAGINTDTIVGRGSRPGGNAKIPEEKYELIQRALVGARSIVVTHEHDDHVAGVIRSSARDVIAPKTLLTRAPIQTLIEHPNNPAIRLEASRSKDYCIFDYDLLYPLAPGVVLIKAPGHTPGSQMVYVQLASGKEVLLIGDVTWAMAGIEQQRQKAEGGSKALGEDRAAIQSEIEWLHNVTQKLSLVNGHDDASIMARVREGVLEDGLDLRRP